MSMLMAATRRRGGRPSTRLRGRWADGALFTLQVNLERASRAASAVDITAEGVAGDRASLPRRYHGVQGRPRAGHHAALRRGPARHALLLQAEPLRDALLLRFDLGLHRLHHLHALGRLQGVPDLVPVGHGRVDLALHRVAEPVDRRAALHPVQQVRQDQARRPGRRARVQPRAVVRHALLLRRRRGPLLLRRRRAHVALPRRGPASRGRGDVRETSAGTTTKRRRAS